MRSVAVAFALAAGVAGAAAASAGATQPPVIGVPIDAPAVNAPSLTSSSRAVTATVVVRGYPLLCGKPRGSVVVPFPAWVEVPKKMPLGTVRVNGLAAAKVAVHDRDVTVTAPLTTGVTCQSIVLGHVTLLFVAGAGIGSAKKGGYALTVRQGARRYKATLTVGG